MNINENISRWKQCSWVKIFIINTRATTKLNAVLHLAPGFLEKKF